MASSQPKVGDRVKTEYGPGTIIHHDTSSPEVYLVEQDEWNEELHSGGGLGKPGHAWWIYPADAVLLQETELQPESVTETLDSRAVTYGKFENLAKVAQSVKTAMFDTLEVRSSLAPDQREALEMIASKVARIINGDPNCLDSWHDIAGYAQLIADRLRGVAR